MDEIRSFGYCECCNNEITDKDGEHYVTEDGKLLCGIECVLEHCSITKVEV